MNENEDVNEKTDRTSLISFKNERLKMKYRKTVESFVIALKVAVYSAHLLGQIKTYNDVEEKIPIDLQTKFEALSETYPQVKFIVDPALLGEAFRDVIINNALDLVIMIIEATKNEEVEYSSIHDFLLPLLFSEEGGTSLDESALENLISEVEQVNLSSILKA